MSFLAFVLGSFFTFGAPPPEVQQEIAYQNCASSWDPAGCQAALWALTASAGPLPAARRPPRIPCPSDRHGDLI
jgi:hypothetical protein